VLVLLSRWAAGWVYLRRLRRTAVPVAAPAVDLLATCRAELGLHGGIILGLHPAIRSPVLFGLRRPTILVPDDWPAMTEATQRAGLLHELAHLARGDHRLVPLLQLVRVLFFFHPGVRWLLARLECERELLCDEAVVAQGLEPRDYARLLLEFAGRGGRLGPAPLGVGNPATIKARIHHLLEDSMKRRPSPPARRRALALGALVLSLAAALGAVRVRALAPEPPLPTKDKEAPSPTRKPYRIAPFDVLNVRVSDGLPNQPVNGPHLVEPDGRLNLGYAYGRVAVGGRTLDEASQLVRKQLGAVLKNPTVSVGLTGWVTRWRNDPARKHPYRIKPYQILNINISETLPGQPIVGPHLVDPDGKVDLGASYGRVAVEGLGLEEAAAAVQKRLGELLKEPKVSVTLGGWENIWHDLTRQDEREADDPPEAPAEKAPAPKPRREALHYGGKNFDQWRAELAMELKPSVRVEAMKALGAFGANGYGADAPAVILETMKGYDFDEDQRANREDGNVVVAAMVACAKLDTEAVPVFREGLKSPNRNVRRFAIEALEQMKSRGRPAVPDLLALFKKEEDPGLRWPALHAVQMIDPHARDLVPALLGALKDESAEARATAANKLGQLGSRDKTIVPALVVALGDKEPRVRAAGLSALHSLNAIKPDLVPTLAGLIVDEDNVVRSLALNHLHQMGPAAKEAVPALISLLKEKGWQEQTLWCLSEIGPDAKEAIPALKELQRTADDTMRAKVTTVLRRLHQ
jgi:HEAT repeat protein/protein involved in polysaccharide export with SLBB domain